MSEVTQLRTDFPHQAVTTFDPEPSAVRDNKAGMPFAGKDMLPELALGLDIERGGKTIKAIYPL